MVGEASECTFTSRSCQSTKCGLRLRGDITVSNQLTGGSDRRSRTRDAVHRVRKDPLSLHLFLPNIEIGRSRFGVAARLLMEVLGIYEKIADPILLTSSIMYGILSLLLEFLLFPRQKLAASTL